MPPAPRKGAKNVLYVLVDDLRPVSPVINTDTLHIKYYIIRPLAIYFVL